MWRLKFLPYSNNWVIEVLIQINVSDFLLIISDAMLEKKLRTFYEFMQLLLNMDGIKWNISQEIVILWISSGTNCFLLCS